MKQHRAFTLIEILVVIGVIATIIGLIVPNFMGIRQRARDVKRKTELGEMKTALRLYYNDYGIYPANTAGLSIQGCGAAGDQVCDGSVCTDYDFAAGGGGCDTQYMKQWPDMDPGVDDGWTYTQKISGDDFCLATVMENPGDPDISSSVSKCSANCAAECTVANRNFCLCAD